MHLIHFSFVCFLDLTGCHIWTLSFELYQVKSRKKLWIQIIEWRNLHQDTSCIVYKARHFSVSVPMRVLLYFDLENRLTGELEDDGRKTTNSLMFVIFICNTLGPRSNYIIFTLKTQSCTIHISIFYCFTTM